MKQDDFFKRLGQRFISGAEVTIEELYQMFKERMIRENKNHKLIDEITKILICSYYEVKNNGSRGATAQEIMDFEKRAIDEYWGKSNYPHEIVFTAFHARVQRDVALILRAIENNL